MNSDRDKNEAIQKAYRIPGLSKKFIEEIDIKRAQRDILINFLVEKLHVLPMDDQYRRFADHLTLEQLMEIAGELV